MLSDLQFSDIFLGATPDQVLLSGVPGSSDPVAVPLDCYGEVEELRAMCDSYKLDTKREEFSVRHGGTAYRVSYMKTMESIVYVARRFPKSVPNLMELGIPTGYLSNIMAEDLRGLLIVSGGYGDGKTTTASAVMASRLNKYGGIGVTVEDPPEMPLEGPHGRGHCYQTWVEQGEFELAIKKLARYVPKIVYVGEVRDPETATQTLRTAISGRLVICTTHADSASATVERMFALANGAAGNSDDVSSLLSNGLAGVIHQKLVKVPGTDKKRLQIESLWLQGDTSLAARHNILQRRFQNLRHEIDQQLNRMRINPRGGN